MTFYDWLIKNNKSTKTAKSYSGAVSGRLAALAQRVSNKESDWSDLYSIAKFKVFCEQWDISKEVFDLNKRGKDMYRRALVTYASYIAHLSNPVSRYEATFNAAVKASLTLPSAERKNRLKSALKKPKSTTVTITIFERNPDVVAEVLFRAAGICEKCGNGAPFKRKIDCTPYLEVHHVVQLSKGGDDTVENAVALCPNCHRQLHYGQ